MNATQPTVNHVDGIDWNYVTTLSRRIAGAVLFSSRNRMSDAEDIAQKVTEELLCNVRNGFSPANLDAVVRNMTRNRTYDWGKKTARRTRMESESLDQRLQLGIEEEGGVLTPEDLAIDREGRSRIRRSLLEFGRRNPRDMRLTLAKRFDGTRSADLAAQESMRPGAVDTAVSRTISKLRVMLTRSEQSRAAPVAGARPGAFTGLLTWLAGAMCADQDLLLAA